MCWMGQFTRYHKRGSEWRHPRTLGAAEVVRFLNYLAVKRHVSARTQNQALHHGMIFGPCHLADRRFPLPA
jgi:hypothetical protein